MVKKKIETFFEFLETVDNVKKDKADLILYRGQPEKKSLIPSIARNNSKIDSTETERKMLDELKRRTRTMIDGNMFDDWDWLVYAQHFGMKTRLLDWTSNPLVALWFACSNEFKMSHDSVIYVLQKADAFLLDKSKEASPFTRTKTLVLKPTLNNERIIAQAGWFTAHKYSKSSSCFVDLRTNTDIESSLIEIEIPAGIKYPILESLNVFGINNQTIFPDMVGLCRQMNWEYCP